MVGMLRTPSPRGSISVVLRKLLQRGKRGSQATYKSATKWAGSLNINDVNSKVVKKIRYQIQEFSVLLYMGRFKFLGPLNSVLSYAPQLSGAKSWQVW